MTGQIRIGAVFPQTELGRDTGAIRTWALEVERLGFRHALVYDHVVGADPDVHQPWHGPYDLHTTFREPFVLFGYLAALTKLELVTGVIILPQRQTALVAKQAAEVDLLTEGRFRLGIGVGWNKVEYEALDKDFTNRGRRSEEQIALLRRLWTEESVTFEGKYERVVGAGIRPLPAQRPIPIWIGGSSEPAYQRIGRIADGWFPQVQPSPKLDAARQSSITRPAPRAATRRLSASKDGVAFARCIRDRRKGCWMRGLPEPAISRSTRLALDSMEWTSDLSALDRDRQGTRPERRRGCAQLPIPVRSATRFDVETWASTVPVQPRRGGTRVVITLIVLAVVVVLAVLFVDRIYNALVKLRNGYKNAFAQIDVQLTRRHDLIPNLVETAKAYMAHERGHARSGHRRPQCRGQRAGRRVGQPRRPAMQGPVGRGGRRADRRPRQAVRAGRGVPGPQGEPEHDAAVRGADLDGEPRRLRPPGLQRLGHDLQQQARGVPVQHLRGHVRLHRGGSARDQEPGSARGSARSVLT